MSGRISAELRKKYKNPAEAIEALGLDRSLLDVPRRMAFDGANKMPRPTRLEYLAVTRTARAINPILAADAKVEYGPIFKGLTTKNFKSRKATIVSDVKKAIKGKTIANDATVEHLAHMLDQFEHADERSMDESVSGPQHRAMEAAAHGHSNLGIPKKVGEEFSDKDKGKHFGDAGHGANLGNWLKKKGASEDSVKKICDMIRDELPENALDGMDEGEIEIEIESGSGEFSEEEGEDEIEQEEGEDRRRHARDMRRGKGRDEIEQEEGEDGEIDQEEAEDRHPRGRDRRRGGRDRRPHGKDVAMDEAAVQQRVDAAISAYRKSALATDEAREFVRPHVGRLPLSLDSAEKVFRHAAEIMGIPNAEKIKDPLALKTLIEVQARAVRQAKEGDGFGLGQDSALASTAVDTFNKLFPGAARIGIDA